LITAGVVVLVTELAKRSDKLGGLIATLPIITILTLIWLHIETQAKKRISESCLVHILVCDSQPCRCFLFYRPYCRTSDFGRRCRYSPLR